MSQDTKEMLQPTTLQEAINIIKFLNISHKQEIAKLKEAYTKQSEFIKKLESNRKRELSFLASELQKYEENLALRTKTVAEQLAEKDLIIKNQDEIIEELNKKIQSMNDLSNSVSLVVDSNSDSGVAFESEESINKSVESKPEDKLSRKCTRRFGDTISFLRRVDFSPMKCKPCNRDGTKKKEEKNKSKLEISNPVKVFHRQFSNEKSLSEEEKLTLEDSILSDGNGEPFVIRPNKMNDSMNNHFSDDGSEDTSEEIFDRVMTRSSTRRSINVNSKYKKINRTKSKMLEHVKVNIID